MDIVEATRSYEKWLGGRISLIGADLIQKHLHMAEGVFPFLRATFYRWMQLWPEQCSDCAGAPRVLAVGDLHVENFGTWRDAEGRLVWGINDFDEAYELPYTLDLVRLAASAHLAIDGARLKLVHKEACAFILSGYTDALRAGGRPVVLGEEHPRMRAMASGVLRDPEHFWAKLDGLKTIKGSVPTGARRALESALPASKLKYRVAHRVAGLGSLGRERYVAIADYCGGKIAREVKAAAPSACCWALSPRGKAAIRYQEILNQAVRAADPFVCFGGGWIRRRLAPDCSRVELSQIPAQRDETKLLHWMGYETANIHLGTRGAAAKITADLKKRGWHWLHHAAAAMVEATLQDWKQWRAHCR
jgi:uncharacterized protein (DUF2252 family)